MSYRQNRVRSVGLRPRSVYHRARLRNAHIATACLLLVGNVAHLTSILLHGRRQKQHSSADRYHNRCAAARAGCLVTQQLRTILGAGP